MAENLVGVNGIDPARQRFTFKPRNLAIDDFGSWLNLWRTGRMPFAPTRSLVIDRNLNSVIIQNLKPPALGAFVLDRFELTDYPTDISDRGVLAL
jgi:hypothetical protein